MPYWLFIYLRFCFLFQKSDSIPNIFSDTVYRCPSSWKWQWSIIVCFVRCITTVIWLWHYIVLSNGFYIINRLFEHNIYKFFRYNRKEGKFFFEKTLFLKFDWFYFPVNLKSLYESYLPLFALFIIFFFTHLIWNQLSTDTATVFALVVSDNGKLRKLFLWIWLFPFFDFHKVIVWVLLTIICIIYHLIFQTYDAKSTLCWHFYSPS